MIVQDVILDSQSLSYFLSFGIATLGQHATAHFHMSRISIGNGEKLDFMPHFGKKGRSASAFDVAVVRMSSDH